METFVTKTVFERFKKAFQIMFSNLNTLYISFVFYIFTIYLIIKLFQKVGILSNPESGDAFAPYLIVFLIIFIIMLIFAWGYMSCVYYLSNLEKGKKVKSIESMDFALKNVKIIGLLFILSFIYYILPLFLILIGLAVVEVNYLLGLLILIVGGIWFITTLFKLLFSFNIRIEKGDIKKALEEALEITKRKMLYMIGNLLLLCLIILLISFLIFTYIKSYGFLIVSSIIWALIIVDLFYIFLYLLYRYYESQSKNIENTNTNQ